MVETFSAADTEDVWGQEFARGSDMGDNGIHPKREDGVSGDRASGGSMEVCVAVETFWINQSV